MLSEECKMRRRQRRAENGQLRAAGLPVPVARRAWRVRVSAIAMPSWALEKSLKSLSSDGNYVWLRSRRDANRLASLDKWKGGVGEIDAAEFRRCGVCNRLLLGREATELRDWLRVNPGQQKPCGPECGEGNR